MATEVHRKYERFHALIREQVLPVPRKNLDCCPHNLCLPVHSSVLRVELQKHELEILVEVFNIRLAASELG